LTGRLVDLEKPRVDFDAKVSLSGKKLIHAQGRAQFGPHIDIKVKSDLSPLDTRVIARLVPQFKVPPLSLPQANIDLEGQFSSDIVDIKKLDLTWSKGQLSASMRKTGTNNAPNYDDHIPFN
jgi:hypothetical protein